MQQSGPIHSGIEAIHPGKSEVSSDAKEEAKAHRRETKDSIWKARAVVPVVTSQRWILFGRKILTKDPKCDRD